METTAIKSKDLSPRLGDDTPETIKIMIDGMKAYRDFGDGIDDRYALSFQVEETGNGFTVTYTWCKGVIPGYRGEPAFSTDDDPQTDSGRFFLTRNETQLKLAKEVDCAIDEVVSEPYDEYMES